MKKNRINNFKYLVITISVLSLFTACCKEDDIIEDPKPEPQAKTGTKTETVQKTIPQPGISLSGTWNVDHPTYQVNKNEKSNSRQKTPFLFLMKDIGNLKVRRYLRHVPFWKQTQQLYKVIL